MAPPPDNAHTQPAEPDRNDLPTFIIAGAARAGTTTLYSWLAEHPDVYMSDIKETNFFCPRGLPLAGPGDRRILDVLHNPSRHGDRNVAAMVTDEADYRALLAPGHNFKARGEASPAYLYYPDSAERIKALVPDCRIVIVLREPVSRAVSHYKVLRAWARETATFEDAIAMEQERKEAGWEWSWDYRGTSLYAAGIEEYLRVFGRAQVGIWLHERMRRDPAGVFREICRFLGIDAEVDLPLQSRNESPTEVASGINAIRRRWPRAVSTVEELVPTSALLKIRPLFVRLLGKEQVQVEPQVTAQLRSYFESDVRRLATLLPEISFADWGYTLEPPLVTPGRMGGAAP